jgi:hypothetical protein
MHAKIKRIAIVTALSVVVFVATGVLSAAAAGPIIGSTKDAAGNEELKGGAATTLVIFAICVAASIVFAIWLNKLLANYKVSKATEDE